ncbi:hypothetical protein ARMGADRAFT_1031879 [Armillaria gallica]|uniref:Uncharacterized protein n=1 Tax=Armillaria gallica TaxID=47427 RepID=A0A2H3DUR2_ARMGA|nr:hypothetical protein ARMGADRAFT_1031879 [Armillaria gallica]
MLTHSFVLQTSTSSLTLSWMVQAATFLEAHIGTVIDLHHSGLYPSLSCPGQAVLHELKDMILHAIGNVTANMHIPAEEKYTNLQGEQAVQLNSGVSIFDSTPRKAPIGIVSHRAWNQFSSTVQKTCSDLTIYCMVLIAIDVGILAIQSVDAGTNTSGIKLMLYLSITACLGSITFAFLLQCKYQDILQCQINHGFRDNCDTLENIAVVQGLPFGLLYWGYVDTVQYQLGDTGTFVPVLLVLEIKLT